MARTPPGDHNPSPDNSTFASRAKARTEPPPRRRLSLRAGAEAETDVSVTIVTERGADRVLTP